MPLAAARVSQPDTDSAGVEKSPGAFRTISEVADELAVPQHVLRFWEGRFAQVRPLKRAGGRRYYRPDDVDLLNGIRLLLHGQGYTIKGAQRVLRENGVRFVQSVGRGEAEALTPDPGEREPGAASSPTATSLQDRTLDEPDTASLHAVLRELEECRIALAELRSDLPTESDALID